MVRNARLAMGSVVGTAPAASGGITMPPLASRLASRATMRCSSSCDGATPITPMKGAPGMRTPGSCGDTAKPFAISQCTRKGVVKRSRRKPKPGMIMVKPRLAGMICSIFDRQKVAGLRPLDMHRPRQRMDAAHLDAGEIRRRRAGLDLAV